MEDVDLFEKKFSILQEISSAIVATDNISMIANLMLDLAINYTNTEKGSLMLVNEHDELTIFAARGIDPHFIRTYRSKIGEGIAGIVAEYRLPVLVEDIEKDERFKSEARDRYKTKSFISCPIVSKNRLLGVLNINDKKDKTCFTEDEFTLIKILANQAAIALENAFLMNQLRAKAAELEEINRKLIEADVIKTEFLTRMSHELRTPLNSINGAVYYLQQLERPSKNELNDYHGIIQNETGKLITIVENLLDFLRFEDEARIIKKNILNISDILKEVSSTRLLKNILSKKNITFELNISKNISDIVGDKTKVIQLFINLIEGIIYYLENSDSINISASQNDFVSIFINCSRQVPDHIITFLSNAKNIFQTDRSEEKLKLYLACKVVEVHNWSLKAENTDTGFTISIQIPKSARQKIEAVIDTTMDMFTDFISELLDVNICSIMFSDEITGDLTIKSAKGLDDEIINRTRIRIGDSIAGWVALEGKPLLIEDIETDRRFRKKNILQYNTKSLLSIPLKVKGRIAGVVNLNNKKSKLPFTTRDFNTAIAISDRISTFMDKLYSGIYSEDELKQFISSFETLLNNSRKYHKKQSIFPDLMEKIMIRLGCSEEDMRTATYISMLYDIGLMPIDENILKKKRLSPSEIRTIKVHPYTTVNMLNMFEFSEDVKNAILHHHERYDGTGYPDGLKGDEIPFMSRVLAVIDAYCAMTSERPYREKVYSKQEAIEEIKSKSGSAYDPEIVTALEEVL